MKQVDSPKNPIWGFIKLIVILFLILIALTLVNRFTYDLNHGSQIQGTEKKKKAKKNSGIIIYKKNGKILRTEKEK
jgi:hypothetical protein